MIQKSTLWSWDIAVVNHYQRKSMKKRCLTSLHWYVCFLIKIYIESCENINTTILNYYTLHLN